MKQPPYIEDIPGTMAQAITEAHSALFEAGGSPQKKTRKAIRKLLPVPPDGWDSTAKHPDGSPFVSMHGNELTWDQVLETYIRGLFFDRSPVAPKFEPAVARIAFTELGEWPGDLMDFRDTRPAKVPLSQFKKILGLLSGDAHVDEYDFNLNGLTYREMLSRFGQSSGQGTDDAEDTGRLNYEIRHIRNFTESSQYSGQNNNWCICNSKDYWNRYTARGVNTMYFLMTPDYMELEPEPHGENYPYDRYSLSMIGAVIDPEGGLAYCCLRRNHEHRLGDHELSSEQLGKLLGRPVKAVLPYIEPVQTIPTIEFIKKQLAAGKKPEEIYGPPVNTVIPGLSEFQVDGDIIIVDTETWLPVLPEIPDDIYVLDDNTVALTLTVDENDWGDTITAWFIYSTGTHRRILVGYNEDDYESREYGPGAIDYCDVTVIDNTKAPGIYQVMNSRECFNTMLITLDEAGNLDSISGWHTTVQYFEKDRVFVMDADPDEWDSYEEAGLQITRVGEDGSINTLFNEIPKNAVKYEYGDGKVNLIVENSDDEICLLHDGRFKINVAPGYGDLTTIHSFDSLALLVDESEETGKIFSLKTLQFIVDDIPTNPLKIDKDGVFVQRDGSKNMITEDGLLFTDGGGAKEIANIYTPNTPIGLANPVLNVAYVQDMNGMRHFVDIASRKDIYGKPLPENADYPYNAHLYVGHTENSMYALYDLDNRQVSGEFRKIDAQPEFVIMDRADDAMPDYNVIDTDTGKFLFDTPLHGKPHTLCQDLSGYSDSGIRKVTRLYRVRDMVDKQRLMIGKFTLEKTPGQIHRQGEAKFSLPDIGWHDGVEALPNAQEYILVSDKAKVKPTKGFRKPYEVVSCIYDTATGKMSKQFDFDRLKDLLDRLGKEREPEAYRKFVNKSPAIAKAIGKLPDFIDWLDQQTTEGQDDEI